VRSGTSVDAGYYLARGRQLPPTSPLLEHPQEASGTRRACPSGSRREVGYDIKLSLTGSIRLAHYRRPVDEFRHVASRRSAQPSSRAPLAVVRSRHDIRSSSSDGISLGLGTPGMATSTRRSLTQGAEGPRHAISAATVLRHTRVTAIRRALRRGAGASRPAGSSDTSTGSMSGGDRGGEVSRRLIEGLARKVLRSDAVHQY